MLGRSGGAPLPQSPWARGHANVSWFFAVGPNDGNGHAAMHVAEVGNYFVLNISTHCGDCSCAA